MGANTNMAHHANTSAMMIERKGNGGKSKSAYAITAMRQLPIFPQATRSPLFTATARLSTPGSMAAGSRVTTTSMMTGT